ncbi:SDR family NAD(P)-dependent oxidoreductase [Streptomyces ipomoeae]|uniref:SDR family NAD(P)-dependent oxidoreductase n=2 Tax=Streptomyces ipomoeae TaxID=103232 RepID=A0AAE8VVF2_9ACTN|nr:SDR family oxidoreductase [Streptomyces ipomoeae]MDX2823316.1 SDR family oxidoreductase [Streptomyces ipomoeae]MDX2874748.1 SDR family oxidoreductase [Streptomyces ipomoeae]TQE18826.1 SDR family NAD(P)-dependent oxidoreductase [Streptomyces ipomoeae]TQE25253.1 SDR family NAD(P)-dependent oxidoreductase [Streptomyces ipomoeae]
MVTRGRRAVVVTGASGGVGRAAALAFAARGDRVALLARGREGLAAAADEVERAGGEALVVTVDMADAKAVEDAAQQVVDAFGRIDVWVNNAFAGVFAPFVDISPDEYRRVTEVTYLGYVFGTRAALRHMLPRDRGTIVQVGSALAYRGIPLQSAYCGAKHAIQGFNEALRCELLHEGRRVRTTMVQLPAVNTPQFDWVLSRMPGRARPVAPIYQPEVAARAIVHAAGHGRRREYWVGGSTAATLIANAVAPALLDRYLSRTGFDSQQDQADQAGRADQGYRDGYDGYGNLWSPADGPHGRDFGAHGRFDAEARPDSAQDWASRNRNRVGAGLLLGGLTAAATAGLRRRGWSPLRRG